ncbi:methyltransferase [Sphingomonas koreensis]|nr:methyltransferase [Sphingomonas koreensis]
MVALAMTVNVITVAIAPAAAAAPAGISASIMKAVDDPSRSPKQVATDIYRKPADTLAFAGVKPGMVIGEFFPGGGYYTQLLSDVVGPEGHVYGLENAGWQGAVKADQDFLAEKKLTNVSIEGKPFGTVNFPTSLDLVWITQNYHDLKVAEFGKVDTAAFNRSVFEALKPGGTYFIVDHQASPGTELATIAKLHRIEKAQVIKEVTASGFVLVNEGTFLRRPADDHTLPIFDERIRGHTDQFVLRFRKPDVRT